MPALSNFLGTLPVFGDSSGGHSDPVTPVLLAISIILLAAKAGGDLMVRIRQPAVLGELLIGVLLGNLVLFGFDGLEFLRVADSHGDSPDVPGSSVTATVLDMLARIGVILLLFEVGLESNLREMTKVGLSSLLVALLGVVTPLALGWLVSRWLQRAKPVLTRLKLLWFAARDSLWFIPALLTVMAASAIAISSRRKQRT